MRTVHRVAGIAPTALMPASRPCSPAIPSPSESRIAWDGDLKHLVAIVGELHACGVGLRVLAGSGIVGTRPNQIFLLPPQCKLLNPRDGKTPRSGMKPAM